MPEWKQIYVKRGKNGYRILHIDEKEEILCGHSN